MFLSFDLPLFLLLAMLSTFIPGAIVAYSILRKEEMLLIEKAFIGFALGIVALPMIPFIAYLALGMEYSANLAFISVAIMYVVAIALFIYSKSYEDILSVRLPKVDTNNLTISKDTILTIGLILILVLSYMARIGSYSPIFQELDPYYYTFTAHQILTIGHNPFNDATSWYPEISVSHRAIPLISYLESSWYTIYSQVANSGAYSNMLLAVIAGMYPPIAAVLAVFFIYLLISSVSKREWGLIAAGVAAFMPVFVYKLAAGEMEVQPYAFFALFFFYALFVLAVRKKDDYRYSVLAGIAFIALSMGSASQILAIVSFVIFMAIEPLLLFLRDKDGEAIKHLAISSAIIFVIGPLFGNSILREIFQNGSPSFSTALPFLAMILFAGALYTIKTRIPERKNSYMALGALLLVGLALYAFTPVGDMIKGMARGGFEIAIYSNPLDRTIAEQGDASAEFGSQMGFVADTYPGMVSAFMWPLRAFFSQAPGPVTSISTALSSLASGVFYPISDLMNAMLALSVAILNAVLGSNVAYSDRTSSLLLLWLFLFSIAAVYSLIRFFKDKEDNFFILFAAIIIPPLIVGIIKAKYTIYASVMLAVAIGYAFSVIASAFARKHDETERKTIMIVLGSVLLLAIILSQFAFKHDTIAVYLILAILGAVIYYAASYIDKEWFEKTKNGLIAAWEGTDRGRHAYQALIIIGTCLIFLQFTYNAFADSLAWGSMQTLFQNNPAALAPKFQQFCTDSGGSDSTVCAAASDPMGFASKGTNYQYDEELCMLSIYSNYSYLTNAGTAPAWENTAAYFRCQRISTYWIDSMEWLRDNTPNDSRIISWWDYGHWENYFGLRNAVIRNEHASHDMIGATAHAFLDGSPEDLKAYMKAHDSEYALFDMELVAGGGSLGGKYGALNYLSCAWDNQTNVSYGPGESGCEAEHLWETIFISGTPCTISTISNRTGVTAYKMYEDVYELTSAGKTVFTGTVYRPYYRPDCINPTDPKIVQYCSIVVKAVPTYCVGPAMLSNGNMTYTTYMLNETYPNGDLKMNKALLQLIYPVSGTYHMGDVTSATLFYTEDQMWVENGEIKSGYEDRKGKFYSSNLYRGLFLNEIPGFDHVYTTPDGMVKIYKISD